MNKSYFSILLSIIVLSCGVLFFYGCSTNPTGGGEGGSSTAIYTLGITTTPEGWGTVEVSPTGEITAQGTREYPSGTVVTVTAEATPVHTFDHWGGDISTLESNPVTMEMNGNKNIIASFQHVYYHLSISVSPTGVGTVEPYGGTYIDGTNVLLKASAESGYAFSSWEGAVVSTTSNPTTVEMTSDKTVTAHFITYTVTYNGNGSTGGTIPTDSNNYLAGAIVTVLGNTGTLEKTQDGISLLFTGWNTLADGTGTDLAAASTFEMGTENVTLYAKWSILRGTGPAGGLIFYDKGGYSGSPSWRYLEVAPQSTEWTGKGWGCVGADIPGAAGTAVGTGAQNTADYMSAGGGADGAAGLCHGLSWGGKTDWFLPSKDELNKMYINLSNGTDENGVVYTPVGGFWGIYWSSSEYAAIGAWAQYLTAYNGFQGGSDKTCCNSVRAVRAF